MQELTDFIGHAQHDAGCAVGAWIYEPRAHGSSIDCVEGDSSAAQWAYIGLESAEVAGGPYGVVVNNRHKYRVADHLMKNQSSTGAAKYRTGSTPEYWGDYQLSGGALIGSRWLGFHQMDPGDNSVAFPGYSDKTGGELRDAYDNYLAFGTANWERTNDSYGGPHLSTSGYISRMFEDGDYLCDQPVGVYNIEPCGNSYAMYSFQKAFRTGTPELLRAGDHDWVREFSTYYVRTQSRWLDGYDEFGSITDRCEDIPHASQVCNYAQTVMTTAWASLVLTPTIFRPKPIAIAEVRPERVIEGCVGGGAGVVNFDHSDSFHPNRDTFIAAYQWDVDDSDGLWWETGADPDYVTADGRELITHTYMQSGNYTATLRVVENQLDAADPFTATTIVRVIVDPAPNVAPGVVAGGPYIIDRGDDLTLEGVVSDPNLGCGEILQVGWDLNNDGSYDDLASASGVVPAASLAGLPTGVPVTIRLRAEDDAGLVDTDETTLIIYPNEPTGVARINPQPAACRQPVRFDASQSTHPNPLRDIVSFSWDVDGNPGVDGGGLDPEFTYTYSAFGTYNGSLTVTDDRGRTDVVPLVINVTEGNRPPTARTTASAYTVAEGESLTLDGSPSTDPDGRCGDFIALYEWDLDGNGSFNDPGDVAGMRPVVPWVRLSQMNWPADRDTGLPANTIRLRVTDSLGLISVVEATVRIYRARPVANFVQVPNPAPVRIDNGQVTATLDARDSYSPIPGVTIARYDWDLNDDGVFEVQNRPVATFEDVFWPLPERGEEPPRFVRLRVTDSNGRVNSPILRQEIFTSIPPTPPTVDPDPREPGADGGVGYHILAGDGVTLDGSDSFDPDEGDRIVAFRWDLDGDGEPDVVRIEGDGEGDIAVTEISPERLAELGLDVPGQYTVTLEVEDLQGLTNEGDAPFTVHRREPEALATANPNPTACGGQVTFDGGRSNHTHPAIDIAAWRWDLNGDGVYDDGEGEVVNFRFPSFTFDGPLVAGLEVEDTRGNIGQTTIEIFVTEGNNAPLADAGSSYALPMGSDLTLSAVDSSEPDAACGDAIVAFRWDLDNDGNPDLLGAEPAINSAQLAALGLNAPGQYPVTLEVEDRFGRTASDQAIVWLVAPPTAVAQASEAIAVCNQLVEFNGADSFHDGPDGGLFEIVEFAWDMDGDGIFERNGADVFQPIVAENRLDGTLRVTDGYGRTAFDTVSVNVNIANLRPTASAGGPYATGLFNGNFVGVDLDARASSDANAPCDEIVEYWWDTDGDNLFGPEDVDGAGSQFNSDYVGPVVRGYTNPDWQVGTTQIVQVRARDSFGLWSEPAEAEIRVRSKAPPTAEILSPRAGQCLVEDLSTLEFTVRQFGGGDVRVTAYAGNTLIGGPVNLSLPANGDPLASDMAVDISGLQDGLRGLTLEVLDDEGDLHIVNAGGNVIMDREGPEISLSALLVEGACYDGNNVPPSEVEVSDAIDPAPLLERDVAPDACGRRMTLTAVDACGNTALLERSYLIAERVAVSIDGAAENSVVGPTRLSWNLEGPAQCVSGVTASLSRNGGAPVPYIESSLIDQDGRYTLALAVSDCMGRESVTLRNFTINAPPVADPGGPYVGVEGEVILLNAGNSSPPEEEDFIASVEWDMDGDGVYELADEVVAFTPMDDGIIDGSLRVTDGQGASTTASVEITVTDISPIIVPGGPYVANQGAPIDFDASGTYSQNPDADPITEVRWDFGDGETFIGGPNDLVISHTYRAPQIYTVTLTVIDEDSSVSVDIPVEVIDVGPTIQRIEGPEDPYELRTWDFEVFAFAASEDDPIQDYQWSFGDGTPPVSGPELTTVSHAWESPGEYVVTVRVRDADSVVHLSVPYTVRPMTLRETMDFINERLLAIDQGPLINGLLVDASDWLLKGIWAEDHDWRGNTMEALKHTLSLLVAAQGFGAGLDDSLWILTRAILRANDAFEAEILDLENPLADAGHPSMVKAAEFMDDAQGVFDDPDYKANVSAGQLAFLANDVFRASYEAYFYLRDATDPCKAPEYNGFRLPEIADLLDRALASNPVNDQLGQAMTGLAADIQAYIDLGIDAPGRGDIIDALAQLRQIQGLLSNRIDIGECAEEACLSDRDALELLLRLMDLANAMVDANGDGTYVRTWQSCMIEAVKFRTALSEMRMEYVCGPNNQYVQEVKVARSAGLRLVDDDNVAGALDYFRSRDIRCLAIRGYNRCLVPVYPAVNQSYPRPEYCPDENDAPVDPGPGGD